MYFFCPPLPPSQQAGHSHILFSIQNCISLVFFLALFYFGFFYETVQASRCELAVTQREVFARWKQSWNQEELTTIIQLVTRWNGLLGYSLMRKHCRFFFFFSDSEITQASFCDKSLQRHPFWMTPSQSPVQLETETGAAQTISCLNSLCESCLRSWKCAFVLSLVHSSTVCL